MPALNSICFLKYCSSIKFIPRFSRFYSVVRAVFETAVFVLLDMVSRLLFDSIVVLKFFNSFG